LGVFELGVERYMKGVPAKSRAGLKGLVAYYRQQQDERRQRLIKILNSGRYREFVADFERFVATPNQDAIHISRKERSIPHRLRHVVPRLIYQRYEIVRAYETVLEPVSLGTLRLIRVDARRLRYLLESLQAVLGPECKSVIEAARTLQE